MTIAALLTVTGAPAARAAGPCPHAGAHPYQASSTELRKAITCLVNRERSKRDRHLLKPDRRLSRAARHHTDTMLRLDCLRHRCPGEPGLERRIRQSGYTKAARAWRVAENLGYDDTPRQMVQAWLHSKFHRRNLLNRGFRDIGVGVGLGAPIAALDDGGFATYAIDFGWRRD